MAVVAVGPWLCSVAPVLHDQQNPRLIKGLLHDLGSTLCVLIRGVGKSVLVGNINVWVCRLETVLAWQQQLQNLQMPQVGISWPQSGEATAFTSHKS